jgi:DNA-binding beta-propeller fold protein YncE
VDASSSLDLRGKVLAETGRALIAHFNHAAAGTRFTALLDALPAGLKVWLLEAGARYTAEPLAGSGMRLVIERGASPAQGSIPGVHHVLGRGASIWTCERGHRVARIDAASGTVAAVRAVARKASHLALDAAGERLFAADSDGNAVIALRADDLTELARWDAPGGPQLPLVSPDGIVCVTGGAVDALTIARPRTGGYATQTITVGACPHDPLLSSDGLHVFIPCAGAAEIVKVRLADGVIVGRGATAAGPSHLARHPAGGRLYSANSWSGTVSCMSEEGSSLGCADSGGWAHAIDISPSGRWVYVGNFLDDTLAVFDAGTLERVALLQTEPYPHGLDVSPDGRYVVATGFGSDCVRLYDADAHVELARIRVGQGSSHTAFVRSDFAWVGCSVSDHLAGVDLTTRASPLHVRVSVTH